MIKCTLLLPTSDNEGNVFEQPLLNMFYEEIVGRFGGYTNEGIVHGAYRMEDGSTAHDTLFKVAVCIEPAGFGDLKRMVAHFGRRMRQESMYLEKTFSIVEFVPAAPEGETWPNAEHPKACGLCAPTTIGQAVAQEDAQLHGEDMTHEERVNQIIGPYREFGGELGKEVVAELKAAGCEVSVYRHKGTVATVVTYQE